MSITLEYGVIIFFGLLKILDYLTTTALNKGFTIRQAYVIQKPNPNGTRLVLLFHWNIF